MSVPPMRLGAVGAIDYVRVLEGLRVTLYMASCPRHVGGVGEAIVGGSHRGVRRQQPRAGAHDLTDFDETRAQGSWGQEHTT